jgi:hypothetical protein
MFCTEIQTSGMGSVQERYESIYFGGLPNYLQIRKGVFQRIFIYRPIFIALNVSFLSSGK